MAGSVPREVVAELEPRVRDIADRIRTLIRTRAVETDAELPNQLAIALGLVSDELRESLHGPVARKPQRGAHLCELLAEVTGLQQDLREHVIGLRFQALARIHASLARLRNVETVADLLRRAPEELCHCCDFDRALVSRVRGSMWVPEHLCILGEQDEAVTRAVQEYLASAEIPLTPMLLETELARRGAPALITDPLNDPRAFQALMAVSQTRGYVAAPVMPTGRVIGFLHADCFGSGRELTSLDRDNIWTFAEGFGLIFERMVLLERIAEQRVNVREAFRLAEDHIERLCEVEVKLAREQSQPGVLASNAAGLFLAPESRIDSLLTAREREVLQIMVSGGRNSQIAEQLVISVPTVKSHVRNICRKLRAENRAQAVSKYLKLVMKENA